MCLSSTESLRSSSSQSKASDLLRRQTWVDDPMGADAACSIHFNPASYSSHCQAERARVCVCSCTLVFKRRSACGSCSLRPLLSGSAFLQQPLGSTRICSWLLCTFRPAALSSYITHLLQLSFQLLSDAASDALQHGYVILGGDFNAKVASRIDISGSDMDFLEDSGIAFHRGMSSPRENLHGRMLIDFCMRTSLLLGTGRLLGDMAASPHVFQGLLWEPAGPFCHG